MSERGPLLTVVRHGETEWSRTGRHTGRTEVFLTERGEEQARALGTVLGRDSFDLVWCSPRDRARRTAELAGLTPFEVVDDLREWEYGDLEGRTTADIALELPGWSIWSGPWPGGEDGDQVAARADRVIERLSAEAPGARVALVGHGHFSRVLAVRWLGTAVADGRWLALDTGSVSLLGWERENRVVLAWNLTVAPGA